MPKIIQMLPVARENGTLPFAVLGLEEGGALWYGFFDYDGKAKDGGPSTVNWRRVEIK